MPLPTFDIDARTPGSPMISARHERWGDSSDKDMEARTCFSVNAYRSVLPSGRTKHSDDAASSPSTTVGRNAAKDSAIWDSFHSSQPASWLKGGISRPDLEAEEDLDQLQKSNLNRKPCWPFGYTRQLTFSMMNAPVQGIACPPDMQREVWQESDYSVHMKIYQGSHSKVYRATCNLTGQPVIIKVYIKARLYGLHLTQIQREVLIHSSLQHENIIDFYGAFEDDSFYFIILEVAEKGDLFGHMSFSYGSEQKLLTELAVPLIHAVSYLHAKGIIHRDIKPENILLSKGMKVKLADFGLAIDQQMEMPVSRTGTVAYMAPEALRNPLKHTPAQGKTDSKLGYNEKVDSWSLAMVIYEVAFGCPSLGGDAGKPDPFRAIQKVLTNQASRLLGPEGRDFLRKNLTEVPQMRMSTFEMLMDPWVKSGGKPLPERTCFPAIPITSSWDRDAYAGTPDVVSASTADQRQHCLSALSLPSSTKCNLHKSVPRSKWWKLQSSKEASSPAAELRSQASGSQCSQEARLSFSIKNYLSKTRGSKTKDSSPRAAPIVSEASPLRRVVVRFSSLDS